MTIRIVQKYYLNSYKIVNDLRSYLSYSHQEIMWLKPRMVKRSSNTWHIKKKTNYKCIKRTTNSTRQCIFIRREMFSNFVIEISSCTIWCFLPLNAIEWGFIYPEAFFDGNDFSLQKHLFSDGQKPVSYLPSFVQKVVQKRSRSSASLPSHFLEAAKIYLYNIVEEIKAAKSWLDATKLTKLAPRFSS